MLLCFNNNKHRASPYLFIFTTSIPASPASTAKRLASSGRIHKQDNELIVSVYEGYVV